MSCLVAGPSVCCCICRPFNVSREDTRTQCRGVPAGDGGHHQQYGEHGLQLRGVPRRPRHPVRPGWLPAALPKVCGVALLCNPIHCLVMRQHWGPSFVLYSIKAVLCSDLLKVHARNLFSCSVAIILLVDCTVAVSKHLPRITNAVSGVTYCRERPTSMFLKLKYAIQKLLGLKRFELQPCMVLGTESWLNILYLPLIDPTLLLIVREGSRCSLLRAHL